MKVSWLTDIHLNLVSDEDIRRFRREISGPSPGAVLISGDIAEATSLERYVQLLGSTLLAPVYFVLGNHDFWGGRVSAVRDSMRQLTRKNPGRFIWLPSTRVVKLTDRCALVGHDGWGDGRMGDFKTQIEPDDWKKIDDLKFLDRPSRMTRIRALADESAHFLLEALREALEKYPRVLVLTHVPPFRETAFFNGRPVDDQRAPWWVAQSVGDALRSMAAQNPRREITVLQGHAYGPAQVQVLPNLMVRVGQKQPGRPTVQAVLEIE
jgi:predicted MPP superfamily phosphohydrolase